MEALLRLLKAYFRRLRVAVLNADEENRGRGVIGGVAGRETAEDVEVEIDRMAETLFREVLERFQGRYRALREVRVFSEHFPEGYGSEQPTILCFIDPFDGSDEYLKRIESSWYCAVTFTSPDWKPLAAGMVDILAGKIYLIGEGSEEYEPGKRVTTVITLRSEGEEVATPDTRVRVPGTEPAVIAAYMGRSKYLRPLVDMLGPLLPPEETRRRNFRQLTWHGKGGSFVYAWIAAGRLIAYIMPNEPVNEILPGWGFAALAGFPILVMEEDGSWTPFSPAIHGQQTRVRALIAACTEGMARDVIRLIQS